MKILKGGDSSQGHDRREGPAGVTRHRDQQEQGEVASLRAEGTGRDRDNAPGKEPGSGGRGPDAAGGTIPEPTLEPILEPGREGSNT